MQAQGVPGEEAVPAIEAPGARRARAVAAAAMKGLAGGTAMMAAFVATHGNMLSTRVLAGLFTSSVVQGMVLVALGEVAGGPRVQSLLMRTVDGVALVVAYGLGGAVPVAGQLLGGMLGTGVASTAAIAVIGGATAEYAGRNSGLIMVACGVLAFLSGFFLLIYRP